MECLLRPFDVRPCTFNIPNIGSNGNAGTSYDLFTTFLHNYIIIVNDLTEEPKSTKLTQPIASSQTMWTCAQRRTIPGHTGFLTFATLLHKDIASSPSTIDQM